MIEEIFKSKFIALDNWCLYIKDEKGRNKQILSVSYKLKTQERVDLLFKMAECLNGSYKFPDSFVWGFMPHHSISCNGVKVATVYKTGLDELTLPVLQQILKIFSNRS